ncbi:MAG: AmmeMemoRadiSam system radical SAM enzyme [Acidiferrobacterales bacterium]|nr:AmmeMemoRadiSam system radical SAM enzyme [Acidiferrobacterales bacterium]
MTQEEVNNLDVSARYWHELEDGRIQCDLCPRFCRLREDQRGLCFVRQRKNNQMVLTTWGRSSGFCIDPIEKKPLNHFFPGSSVLSFGTAGCNLACKFCQNWDISKSREMDRLGAQAYPETIASLAKQNGCRSVAFTYNDPVIFLEYAVDIAKACRVADIKTVAVTAGYITQQARREFFSHMDAVNVDLKAFSESFYREICGGKLKEVLETLQYIRQNTDCWLEITTLLIPGKNDSEKELTAMSQWLAGHLGTNIPLHFTAFHPDWKMQNIERTPAATLLRAREIAQSEGHQYVYVGNVHHPEGASTYCPNCHAQVIQRDWHRILRWKLDYDGQCLNCGSLISGHIVGPPGISSPPRRLHLPQVAI